MPWPPYPRTVRRTEGRATARAASRRHSARLRAQPPLAIVEMLMPAHSRPLPCRNPSAWHALTRTLELPPANHRRCKCLFGPLSPHSPNGPVACPSLSITSADGVHTRHRGGVYRHRKQRRQVSRALLMVCCCFLHSQRQQLRRPRALCRNRCVRVAARIWITCRPVDTHISGCCRRGDGEDEDMRAQHPSPGRPSKCPLPASRVCLCLCPI